MFDESTNIESKASFLDIKKEAFKLFHAFHGVSRLMFPSLSILADEYASDFKKLSLREMALLFGTQRKIEFIKEVRSRFTSVDGGLSMGLYEAKMLADGIYNSLLDSGEMKQQ